MILVVYLKLKKKTRIAGKLQLKWPYACQASALQLRYICGVRTLYEERFKGYLYRSNNILFCIFC